MPRAKTISLARTLFGIAPLGAIPMHGSRGTAPCRVKGGSPCSLILGVEFGANGRVAVDGVVDFDEADGDEVLEGAAAVVGERVEPAGLPARHEIVCPYVTIA